MPSEAAQEVAAIGLRPDAFIALPIVLLILAGIAVSLRVYVRAFMTKSFGLDDWLLLFAFTIFVADAGLFIHIGALEKYDGIVERIDEISAYSLAGMLIYLVDQIALKVSMAVFFLRIVQQKWQKLIIYVSMGIYASYSIAFVFVALFQCGVPKVVNFISGENCMPWDSVIGPMNYIAGAFNAVIDWIFIITPILVVSKAMMTKRAKVSVCAIIALGALGSVASVARIPLLKDIRTTQSLSYFRDLIPIALTSIVESGLGITAISLAALRPLMARCIERTKGSSGRTYGATDGQGTARVHGRSGTRGTNRLPDDVFDGTNKIPLLEVTPFSQGATLSGTSSTEEEVKETV